MKFKVDQKVFEEISDACFGVVIAKGIDNKKVYPFIKEMLEENTKNIRKEFEGHKVKEHEKILPYREAFTQLSINPNKFLCSIEALVTRITKGHDMPSINPIVDLGNALSLKYCIPLGAHDIDKFKGNIEIRYAREDDEFISFGATEPEPVGLEEVVYASGNEIKTRRWTWRQGEKGKITEETCNVFFPIDGFIGKNDEDVIKLRDELAELVKEKLGAEVEIGFVDIEHPEFKF